MLVEACAPPFLEIQIPRNEVTPRLQRSFQPGFHGTQLFFRDDRIG
jgi:hypothetical protein